MLIKIVNFGPLKEFQFDLSKKFIAIYGNNNIGKSYAMQMVYLLLKTFANLRDSYYFRMNRQVYPMGSVIVNNIDVLLKKLVQQFVDNNKIEKDVTDKVRYLLYSWISEMILPYFMNVCENTFGNFEKLLEGNPHIYIELEELKLDINMARETIEGNVELLPIRLKKTESGRHASRQYSTHLDVYVYQGEIERPVNVIGNWIRTLHSKIIHKLAWKFSQVYFLPASRSGIYSGMNAFGAIVAELARNRSILTKKIELPGISEPISDYFISLSNITNLASVRGRNVGGLSDYCTKIENTILKGKVQFDKSKNALIYVPDDLGTSFEMTEVSSMVSEVSPIVAFLKYIIHSGKEKGGNNAILFIEEPEAHLHPANQIKLVEVFAELISENVTLVMSSHSNYVFNKLNNLILSKKLDYSNYQPIFLEHGEGGSSSKVLPMDECGVDDENFLDVSEELYQEREAIIQKLSLGEWNDYEDKE